MFVLLKQGLFLTLFVTVLLPLETMKRQCKVLFEYIPQNEDELELKVGDTIDINEEVRKTYVLEIKWNISGYYKIAFVRRLVCRIFLSVSLFLIKILRYFKIKL